MTNYFQTVLDGFAKKCAGLSGSNTWNDIMGYAYLLDTIVGPTVATITDGSLGLGSKQIILSANLETEVSNWRLTDDTVIGVSSPGQAQGADYTSQGSFRITFRRL